jgi:hypothetical protein
VADVFGSTDKQRMTTTFSKLQINQQVPDDAMRFKFPVGIKVLDELNSQVKMVDEKGEATRPALTENGEPITLSPGLVVSQAPEGTEVARATDQEPQSWTSWLLPVSIGAFVLGGVLWVAQVVRQRRRVN